MNTLRRGVTTLSAIALFALAHPSHASNTITGTITDCTGTGIRNALVYISATTPGSNCTTAWQNARMACRLTDASGTYSFSFQQNPNAVQWCIVVVPDGYHDGWGGCVGTCILGVCCNSAKPNITIGSFTSSANANNQNYTQNVQVGYSGSCPLGGNGTVEGLTPTDCSPSSIDLAWYAPSVAGCQVASYEVRYSTSPIDDSNWSSASVASGAPTPAAPGTQQSMSVGGLSGCTWHYFAIKTRDQNNNLSGLSNVASARTKCSGSSICQIGD